MQLAKTRLDRDARRELILDVAQSVFLEEGFANASMSTIAARLDLLLRADERQLPGDLRRRFAFIGTTANIQILLRLLFRKAALTIRVGKEQKILQH